MLTGLILIMIGTSLALLWARYWTFGSRKMLEYPCVTATVVFWDTHLHGGCLSVDASAAQRSYRTSAACVTEDAGGTCPIAAVCWSYFRLWLRDVRVFLITAQGPCVCVYMSVNICPLRGVSNAPTRLPSRDIRDVSSLQPEVHKLSLRCLCCSARLSLGRTGTLIRQRQISRWRCKNGISLRKRGISQEAKLFYFVWCY